MIAAAVVKRRPLAVVGVSLPFDEVYRRHADAVYRFCLSQVGEPSTAEDVAAETFASAFAAFERAQPDADGMRPWLFRIARNAAIDHHRRQGRMRQFLARVAGHAATPAGVETQAEIRADLRQVVAALAELPRRDRLLVGLRIAAGLSFAEIAVVTGMNEAAARVATHRALRKLRAMIEE